MKFDYTQTINTLRQQYDTLMIESINAKEKADKIKEMITIMVELTKDSSSFKLFEDPKVNSAPKTTSGMRYKGMRVLNAIKDCIRSADPYRPTVNQIYEALVVGGYEFHSPSKTRLRGLSRTIGNAVRRGELKQDDNGRIYL